MDMDIFSQLRRDAMASAAPYDSIQLCRKKYDQLLDPVCRKWGLTRSELDVLLFLHNNPGFNRASDIVAMRGMTKSHVSLSVANLEGKGLLVRSFEPTDRRVAHLHLTPAVTPIVEEGLAIQDVFFSQLFAGLTPEEFQVWLSILRKVNENIVNLDRL